MVTSFSCGGSQNTRKEPTTMGKQLVNFYHKWLRVECTLFCNLQSRARTHAVLVIGLYELLDPMT
jgi:urease accessory protein UreF